MKKNIFKRKRVVMTTIGSLGDLHPYIALALEMRKRSLNIEFRQIRPETLEPDTPEYYKLIEDGSALAVDLILDQLN